MDNYIWMFHDGRQAVVVDPGIKAGSMETHKGQQGVDLRVGIRDGLLSQQHGQPYGFQAHVFSDRLIITGRIVPFIE